MDKKRERDGDNQAKEDFEFLTSDDSIILYLDKDCQIPDSFKKGDAGSKIGDKYKVWINLTNKKDTHDVRFTASRADGKCCLFSAKLLENTAGQPFRLCLADINRNNNQNKWKEFSIIYPEIEKEKSQASPKKASVGPASGRIAPIAQKSTPRVFTIISPKPDLELERKAMEYALNDEALKEKALQMLVERHSAEVEKEAKAAKERAKDKIVNDLYNEVVTLPAESPKVKYLWYLLRDKVFSEMTDSDKQKLQKEAFEESVKQKKSDLLKTKAAEIEAQALVELKEEIKIKEMKKNFIVNPEAPANEKELSEVRTKAKGLFDQQLAEIQKEMK